MNEKKNYVLKAETGYIESKLRDEPIEADQVDVRALYWLIDDLSDKLAQAQVNAVWHTMALDLARVVNKHRKERLVEDKERAWKMAQEMLVIEILEKKNAKV